jgi:hypothetical protein
MMPSLAKNWMKTIATMRLTPKIQSFEMLVQTMNSK